MTYYVKPYSDILVKYLLGSQGNEDILLHFINAVLENGLFKRISEVVILNPFNLQLFSKDKMSILDVKARDEKSRLYNIEIQSYYDEGFTHRVLYYWSKLYSSQLRKGENYLLLEATISINLINFLLIEDCEDFHNWFYLAKNKDSNIIYTDHLFLHFLELSKWAKHSADELSTLDKWLYFFKYEGKEGYDMKVIMKDDEIFQKAHDIYERFTKDDELRELYETQIEAERRLSTSLELAEKKGIEKGIEQGIEQGVEKGIEKGKEEIARTMLQEGLDIKLISKTTGLSESKIQRLMENLKS